MSAETFGKGSDGLSDYRMFTTSEAYKRGYEAATLPYYSREDAWETSADGTPESGAFRMGFDDRLADDERGDRKSWAQYFRRPQECFGCRHSDACSLSPDTCKYRNAENGCAPCGLTVGALYTEDDLRSLAPEGTMFIGF